MVSMVSAISVVSLIPLIPPVVSFVMMMMMISLLSHIPIVSLVLALSLVLLVFSIPLRCHLLSLLAFSFHRPRYQLILTHGRKRKTVQTNPCGAEREMEGQPPDLFRLFESRALSEPQAPAVGHYSRCRGSAVQQGEVTLKSTSIDYGDLLIRASSLARTLEAAQGSPCKRFLALYARPSIPMVVGVLGYAPHPLFSLTASLFSS